MRKIIVFLIILFLLPAFSKPKQDKEILDLIKKIKENYLTIESFKADFKQVKKSPLLKNSAITYGKFYFKKPDKLLLEFTKPYKLKIFYKKNKIYRFDEKRKVYAVLNIKRHKENAVNFLNVSKTFDFLTKYFVIKKVKTKKKDIYLIFFPKKRRVKKKFKIVEMWLDSETFLFKKLHIEEQNGTVTDILVSRVKTNIKIKDSVFEFSKKGYKKEKWQ
ncbi:outer membrane lipoprotein carrier protein [Thermotomaculum hydrothermale]|uniref:Outer membrane lipoprotein carrier protein n=1 Tax=Thermotomaculum hydrothermale TaxID=981385 RepID=A0A7R6PG29_9BACT|nr:outer membrane lipoprotein carrier protein LolA [Thermotomaculum hydrothermale]BBB31944.1 outer membrane lipoprotein carrier protein [Thermotomaculum hydrothermale]